MDMLRITNLKKHFGDKEVLTGLYLSVPEHSVFGFVGENGAGKTTTMKIILGLLKSDRGEVFVSGERVKYGQTATNRYIGYLPDVPEFYSFMTAREYLRLCGESLEMGKNDIEKRSDELLTLVGLSKENHRIALIVFVFLYSGIFTKEYETNTLILILTKGLSRYKVVFAKFFVMFTMWTIGYLLCFAVTYGYNAFFWDNSIAVGLLPAMVHWWLFGVWIIGLIVLFSVLVKSYTGVLLGTGGSVLGVYLISFFPKAWKYTPTTLMESASLLIGTKSIEDYGIAVLITILLVVICLIVSITVMNRKQL